MSDDLVKRLRQSWDVDRSIMMQTGGWMKERRDAADRIEELEANLAKAVKALQTIKDRRDYQLPKSQDIASATLAELKGETEE
jgi:predicted metalloendopeptidase